MLELHDNSKMLDNVLQKTRCDVFFSRSNSHPCSNTSLLFNDELLHLIILEYCIILIHQVMVDDDVCDGVDDQCCLSFLVEGAICFLPSVLLTTSEIRIHVKYDTL